MQTSLWFMLIERKLNSAVDSVKFCRVHEKKNVICILPHYKATAINRSRCILKINVVCECMWTSLRFINWCSPQCEKWINWWHGFSSTKMRFCLLFSPLSHMCLGYLPIVHLLNLWLTDLLFFCISTISSKSTTSWLSSNVCERSCKFASLKRFSCSSFCIFC